MKAQDLILGVIGIAILVVWGSIYGVISWIFTGEAFPND
jgi:hypothetical protein